MTTTQGAPEMIELDTDEAYLLESILAQPRATLGNAITWSAEDRRTTFYDCITGLMRSGLVHFRKDLCRMALTGFGYRALRVHLARLEAERKARPVVLEVPQELVDDLAAAIRSGCWVWKEERERPMLDLRDKLLAAKEALK